MTSLNENSSTITTAPSTNNNRKHKEISWKMSPTFEGKNANHPLIDSEYESNSFNSTSNNNCNTTNHNYTNSNKAPADEIL